MIADDAATSFVFMDKGRDKYLFGLLRAVDEDRQSIPDTELIRVSRGFVFITVLAFCFGFIICVRDCGG